MRRPATSAHASPAGAAARAAGVGAFVWAGAARARAAALGGGDRAAAVECRLRGASMADAIPRGARIRIVFDDAAPRPGDVVAFLSDGRVVAHRVVARCRHRGATMLLTRGDARVLCDAPVRADAVLGRVAAYNAGSGWQAVGSAGALPRRERIAAAALQGLLRIALAVNARSAVRLAGALEAAALRRGWSRARLYAKGRR